MQNQLGLWWGPDIHDILINIVCLIFDWLCFLFVVCEIISHLLLSKLVSYKGALTYYPGTLLLTFFFVVFFRTLWTCMPLMTISIFDVILGCLDVCLTCLDKIHVVCYISILTLIFCDSAWEAVRVRTLTLLYCDLILFSMQFFRNHLAYPGIYN